MKRVLRALVAVASGSAAAGIALSQVGCAKPVVARDGTLVMQQQGAGRGAVLTANGVEYHDESDLPAPAPRRDAREPWKPPTGFLLPRNGRFTKTSSPTVVAQEGIRVVLRPSDTRVPAWGGEVLVRVDVAVPVEVERVRAPLRVALVLDGYGPDTPALTLALLEQLGAEDHLVLVDARGGRVIVPSIPATNRSLALGAAEHRAARRGATAPDLARALTLARAELGAEGPRMVVVLSEVGDRGLARAAEEEAAATAQAGIVLHAFASAPGVDLGRLEALVEPSGGTASNDRGVEARAAWLKSAVPAPGEVAFRNVGVRFEGTPAPAHVLEASGGEVLWQLDAGELALGELRDGEARTDVVRVSVPPWTAGEPFAFTVTARALDRTGRERTFTASVPCVYDDSVTRLAESRHGDVIAYASALATLRRLEGAFIGNTAGQRGGLRRVAALHARSMALLGRDTGDGAVRKQAEMLEALLRAAED